MGEAELFSRALSNMMMWYAHPKVLTLKLTALPQDYPTGFTFPSGMVPNKADYFGRGWCFCESSVSNLRKDYDYVLDLGKLQPAKKKKRASCSPRREIWE